MFQKIFVSLLAMLALTCVVGSMTGCSTVAGVGQDIQQGGRAITNEANENKR